MGKLIDNILLKSEKVALITISEMKNSENVAEATLTKVYFDEYGNYLFNEDEIIEHWKANDTKTANEIFAENLASSGYSDVNKLKNILNKLTVDEIETLSYAAYRACEKIGEDAFDCKCLVD